MDPAHAPAHQRLWTDLTRQAPPRYRAAPASLLAFTAWQRGNGALANLALEQALAANPGYSMAQLLRQVITAGAPPALARLPTTPDEVVASYGIPARHPARQLTQGRTHPRRIPAPRPSAEPEPEL